MSDYTLADGTEVTFDTSKISITEYRRFSKGSLLEDQDDEILARCSGLAVDTVRALPLTDYQRLLKAFFKAATTPTDPN